MKTTRLVQVSGILIAASLAFTACAGNTEKDQENEAGSSSQAVNTDAPLYELLPERIQEAGKIVNAGDLTYAPYEWLQEDGKTVKGLEVDIAEALSNQLGVPFEWLDVQTDAALSGIQSKRYDVLLASMTYTDERAKTYDYVTYLKAASGFITQSEQVDDFGSLEDVCGKKIAALRGTIQVTQLEELSETCVGDGNEPISVQALDSDQSAILQVRQGAIDATCTNSAVGEYAVSQADDDAISMVPGLTLGDSVYGIMLGKDEEQLRDAIHAAMNAIIEDGTYGEVLQEWGIEDLALEESLINNAS